MLMGECLTPRKRACREHGGLKSWELWRGNPPRSDEESARCLSLSFWLLRQDKVPRKRTASVAGTRGAHAAVSQAAVWGL